MAFAWKGLFGLGLFNIFLVAIEIMVLSGNAGELTRSDLLIMSIVNWTITISTLLVLLNFLGHKKLERPKPVPSPLANMAAEAD